MIMRRKNGNSIDIFKCNLELFVKNSYQRQEDLTMEKIWNLNRMGYELKIYNFQQILREKSYRTRHI